MIHRRRLNNAIYRQLIYSLKFEKRIPTCELMRRFPNAIRFVMDAALLDLPKHTLREVIPEEKKFNRLVRLKKRLLSEKLITIKK